MLEPGLPARHSVISLMLAVKGQAQQIIILGA